MIVTKRDTLLYKLTVFLINIAFYGFNHFWISLIVARLLIIVIFVFKLYDQGDIPLIIFGQILN